MLWKVHSFNIPGHGAAEGTTNLAGTFKSPNAALYNCKVRKTAFHSFWSDLLEPEDESALLAMNNLVLDENDSKSVFVRTEEMEDSLVPNKDVGVAHI